MRNAYRVADVRAAEEALMARLPAGALMQRAAAGLARRWVDVTAVATAPDRIHAEGLAALRDAGGRLVEKAQAADLVVDGILGIGGRGGLRDNAAALVRDAVERDNRPTVVAVDLPSGVDADTGAVAGAAVRADITVTFGVLKPGLVVGAGAVHSGLVDLVDIGLTLDAEPALSVPDLDDIQGWWPRPRAGDDKYTRGVVGVATGSVTYPGAALLSTGGALAGPTGMVRYAGAAAEAVRSRYPSVIPTDRVADAGRVQAWTCGCGLGTDDRARAELTAVLDSPVPVCVDADGLTLFADKPVRRDQPLVLTPHDREFARLNGGAEPGDDRVGAARALAAKLDATVLLKGDRTIVAGPGGRVYVNPTGSPALATAGTGDVLAGLLGSLLGGGLTPERAAIAAAYLHGLAGRAAAAHGPVTSADVAEAMRGVVPR
jgi:hydroxyethylthiazole kinase-like uncharacterized protein yjeF